MKRRLDENSLSPCVVETCICKQQTLWKPCILLYLHSHVVDRTSNQALQPDFLSLDDDQLVFCATDVLSSIHVHCVVLQDIVDQLCIWGQHIWLPPHGGGVLVNLISSISVCQQKAIL